MTKNDEVKFTEQDIKNIHDRLVQLVEIKARGNVPVDFAEYEHLAMVDLPQVLLRLERLRNFIGWIKVNSTDKDIQAECEQALRWPSSEDFREEAERLGVCRYCSGDYQHCCWEAAEAHKRHEKALRDFADYGGRFDTHPTTYVGPDIGKIHENYTWYLERINRQIKNSAKVALGEKTWDEVAAEYLAVSAKIDK